VARRMLALQGMASLRHLTHPIRARWPGRTGQPSLLLSGLLVALLAGTWLIWSFGQGGRALRDLSPPERQAVYQRTTDDLRALCGPNHPKALQEHCRELAATVAPLPECDAACAELVRPILTPLPTR
jgi:hypothetical protein